MGETFFPADAFYLPEGGPAVLAFFENPGLVQFIHRMAGYLLFAFGIVVWLRGRKSAHPATRGAFMFVLVALAGQVVLGIVTVVHAAPLSLGLIHQLGAVAVWVAVIRARHRAQYPITASIRGTK
jgi:cytochrome c oxidase assembly protein subunit 15